MSVQAVTAGKRVRDRADVQRQVKLVVVLAVVAALLAFFALDIRDPQVLYLLEGRRTKDNLPREFNGLAWVWSAFGYVVAMLVLAAVNRFPRGWVGALALVGVGIAFYLGFVTWYYADLDSTIHFVSNPLPATFKYAPPLVLGAIAGVLCERAGVVNIAIEGQLLMGAFFGFVVASLAYSNAAGLVGGAVAGVVIAWLLGVFALRYRVDQVVVGVVLIALALGLTTFLNKQIPTAAENERLNAYLASPPDPLQAVQVPVLSEIPLVGPALFEQTVLAYIAMLAPVVIWFVLYRTRWGLRVRSVGEHPKAADTVGITVNRVKWQAILLGGAFAGLGGAFFTVGSTGSFNNDASNGQGFVALAAVIMGRWHPIGAALAGLFFAFMFALKDELGTIGKVPSELIAVAPFLATLIAVAGFIGRVRPPAADGVPYEKG